MATRIACIKVVTREPANGGTRPAGAAEAPPVMMEGPGPVVVMVAGYVLGHSLLHAKW